MKIKRHFATSIKTPNRKDVYRRNTISVDLEKDYPDDLTSEEIVVKANRMMTLARQIVEQEAARMEAEEVPNDAG